MRLLFLSAIIIVFAGACKGPGNKYFTGTVEYTYTYSSDSLNADSLARIRPSKSDFRYDENNYQSRFIAKDTETYYYSGITNKCPGKINSEANYSCEDYSTATDSIVSWKIYDTGEKALGYDCRILEIQKGNSWVKYHVAKDLAIAPATYQKHKSYNWDFYGEKAGGDLILKSEHRFKRFTMKGMATAISVKKEKFRALEINDSLFAKICK